MSNEELDYQPELTAEDWGQRLVAARESQSLSAEQAANDLNLPLEYIEILEQGGLEGLPSLVFARGYIRQYAKLLNLDDNDLVAEYEALHGVASVKGQIRPVSRVREQVKMNDPVMKLSSWIFLLAIVGLSVWWWQTQYGSVQSLETEQVSAPEQQLEPTAEETAPVATVNEGSAALVLPKLDDAPLGEQTVEVEKTEPIVDVSVNEAAESEPQYLSAAEIKKLQQTIDQGEAEQVDEAPQAETVTASLSDLSEASIRADFVAECWVSIKDADGKTLFNNLRGKGQSIDVSGKAPLTVLIGAADAVGSFSFNGSTLDLAEHSRKNIVRLSLPLAE